MNAFDPGPLQLSKPFEDQINYLLTGPMMFYSKEDFLKLHEAVGMNRPLIIDGLVHDYDVLLDYCLSDNDDAWFNYKITNLKAR